MRRLLVRHAFGDDFALVHLPGERAVQVEGERAILGNCLLTAVDFQRHVAAGQIPKTDLATFAGGRGITAALGCAIQ